MNHLYKQFLAWCFFFIWLSQANIFPTDLCGPISGSLTIAGSPYIVTCNVLVPDGATLTIDPGVVIKFELGHDLEVAGTLIAEGTAGNGITFTSNALVPVPGDWGKIYFMESENSSLDYCTIEYAGDVPNSTAVSLWLSTITIQNTTIQKTSGPGLISSFSYPNIIDCIITENIGIGIDSDACSLPLIYDCEITNNSDYAISIFANSVSNIGPVTISGNTKNSIRVMEGTVNDGTWLNHDVPYVINGNIIVNDGQTLNIDAGTDLLFNGDYVFTINGSLVAVGDENNWILFSSNQSNPAPGDWRQLYFNNAETSSLVYCTIEYGGSNSAAINMLNSNPYFNTVAVWYSGTNGINLSNSSPEIINGDLLANTDIGVVSSFDSYPILNTISIEESGDYAISMYADNIKNIIGDTKISLNGKNSIKVEGGTVNSGTWLNHGVPYVIAGHITVNDGEALTIDQGNELRFNSDYVFEVNGTLIADGTENDHIIFTSNKVNPQPGDWRHLSFQLSDPGTKLNYCEILYAGSNTAALNLTLSSFEITNTYVQYSQQRGIYLNQSSPTVRSCFVTENIGNGVHILSGRPDLGTSKDPGLNAFFGNGGWEVYNNTADTIYAQHNFWGDTDSAAIDANHIYDDDENSSKGMVVFMPYLKTIPTDVEEIEEQIIPGEFVLEQNYPNPFNPSTTINFSIPEASFVSLKIFNSLGQEIETLLAEELSAGNYKYDWNAKTFTSGIYFYRLQAGDPESSSGQGFVETKKMILLK